MHLHLKKENHNSARFPSTELRTHLCSVSTSLKLFWHIFSRMGRNLIPDHQVLLSERLWDSSCSSQSLANDPNTKQLHNPYSPLRWLLYSWIRMAVCVLMLNSVLSVHNQQGLSMLAWGFANSTLMLRMVNRLRLEVLSSPAAAGPLGKQRQGACKF